MYASGDCCEECREGLGFPIVPIIMGVASAVSYFRGKGGQKITEDDARKAVQQIYLELLEREPDPGAQGYIDCLYKGAQHDPNRGWCDVDFIRTEILKSPEYKDVQMRKAAAVYSPAVVASPSGVLGTSYAGGGGMDSLLSGGIAGIPFTWIAVGLGLVLLMKRK